MHFTRRSVYICKLRKITEKQSINMLRNRPDFYPFGCMLSLIRPRDSEKITPAVVNTVAMLVIDICRSVA
jgi:hypothetical protein